MESEAQVTLTYQPVKHCSTFFEKSVLISLKGVKVRISPPHFLTFIVGKDSVIIIAYLCQMKLESLLIFMFSCLVMYHLCFAQYVNGGLVWFSIFTFKDNAQIKTESVSAHLPWSLFKQKVIDFVHFSLLFFTSVFCTFLHYIFPFLPPSQERHFKCPEKDRSPTGILVSLLQLYPFLSH